MQKLTQHIHSFKSADESVTVVVDTAVSLRVASSAPITIPLDRLEDVYELLGQVIADTDVAALLPTEEPEPVEDDEPEPEVEP